LAYIYNGKIPFLLLLVPYLPDFVIKEKFKFLRVFDV